MPRGQYNACMQDESDRAEQEALVEGLVHLADMLEVADPRRAMAGGAQAQAGDYLTLADWRARCHDLQDGLARTRPALRSLEQRTTVDEAIRRIRRLLDS